MTKAQQDHVSILIQEFSAIPNWEDRYKKIIDLGRALPDMPESQKTDSNKVKGCQSQVWLHAEFRDGRIYFSADSDASIVKGLVALVLKIYSEKSPQEILNTSPEFVEKLGLNTHLSQARANGLVSMIKQVKFYALAFAAKNGIS